MFVYPNSCGSDLDLVDGIYVRIAQISTDADTRELICAVVMFL